MLLVRIIFTLISAYMGYYCSSKISPSLPTIVLGTAVGGLFPPFIFFLESILQRTAIRTIITGLTALFVSLAAGLLSIFALHSFSLLSNSPLSPLINFFILFSFSYLFITISVKRDEMSDLITGKFLENDTQRKNIKIFDTSVIIDGRIADICETGFLEGDFVVPKFILHELQQVADSSDSLKRKRGRRGLDILQRMKKTIDLHIKIIDDDFPKIKEVDTKLVTLAQKLKGTLITNDFNLNKVSELQGVPVLNINQLANAVKPVILPGELMTVYLIKEGKEQGQGVAYLDDGTMIVVENAKKHIGKTVDVEVTSVLQTTAGRMIFTKIKDPDKNGIHH